MGVPSFSTTAVTRWVFPAWMMRAMNDLSFMWAMEVSTHFSSPSIISPLSVRYQRAWNLPRYCCSCATISASHFTLGAPYQPGTISRRGEPWWRVSGWPLSA